MVFSLANRAIGWVGTALMLSMVIGAAVPALAQDYPGIIASPDRSDADRQTDKRRDPVELLTFTGAKMGWSVLDMGAGAGYSTELMARSVGPSGKVYGVVFAAAADDPQTGYALTAAEVGSDAARGRVATAEVSTQGCD